MTTKIILVLLVGGALVLVWGYWYALNHAALHLRVDDYGLKSPSRAYDTPHGVSLVLRDAANGQLAVAVWWVVPLRHIGGLPRQYFELVIAIDSRACAAVTRPTGS